MSTPTEADREKAATAWEEARDLGVVEAVAQALADEREKARAPFLALADEANQEIHAIAADLYAAYSVRFRWDIADRIRRAAEGDQ